jgi:hypothetical protein
LNPIIHVTHKNADPDSFAGVLWGKKIFGGCTLIHKPSRVVKNLMEELNLDFETCWDFKRVFAYDVDSPEKLPLKPDSLVVFDHHPRNSFKDVRLYWRPRASLSMNLYDISREAGYELDEDILFAFAVALTTDTALLRTATSEELLYLSLFLQERRMEDVFKVIFKGAVKIEDFMNDLNSLNVSNGICYGRFSKEDHFMFFCDTFMYALDCKIVLGELEWGVWFFSEKAFLQKMFGIIKKMENEGYVRKGNRVFEITLDIALRYLSDLLP